MKNGWLGLALAFLCLTGWSARAADYTFPGALPGGCADLGGGNYLCDALTLDAHDTIAVAAGHPAAIRIGGALMTGANTHINAAGSPSALTLQVDGAFTLGNNSTLHANLTITTAAATSIGTGSTIRGNIDAGASAVGIDPNATIIGNLTTQAGVVTTQSDVTISGAISTYAGAVNLGNKNTVSGNIATHAGVVTIVQHGTVGGGISTTDGAVTISHDSRVYCGIKTGAGVVTLTDTRVGASIVTVDGGITSTGTKGSSTGTAGGDIHSTGAGVITLTDVDVGGDLVATSGTLTTTRTHVRGSVIRGAGAYSPTDSTSNDGSVALPAPPPGCAPAVPIAPTTSAPAAFDTLETGANIPWSTAVHSKPIYTKLAGAPFTLDIAALKADGTLESAYVASGAASKHVKLELFADVGAACSDYASPVAAQTATFTSASSSGAPGRTVSGAITVIDAHRSLLVRIRECADSTCASFTSVPPACSSDRFSVRPSALTLSTTTTMATAPSSTEIKTITAGANFKLRATTSPTAAYGGVMTLDKIMLTAQEPSKDASMQSGGKVGDLTPSTLTANASEVDATYSEAGYLYIGIGAFRDDDFTLVDSAAGDCIGIGAANNANLADTLVDGKYGCSIGNKNIVALGRFVPDHFDTVISLLTPMICPAGLTCPAAGFVYSGQPFALTVTAYNLAGTPTTNYSGLLARDVALEAWSAPGMLVALNQNPLTMKNPAMPAGNGVLSQAPVTASAFTLGVANGTVAYTFPARYPATALAAPTDIHLRAREIAGAASERITSARLLAANSVEGGVKVVSGRLQVANNYGSELLTVPIEVRVQYWDGVRFVNSTTDQKTSFTRQDVARNNCKKGLIAAGQPRNGANCKAQLAVAASPASFAVVNGASGFRLAAPGAQNTGSVDLNIDAAASPWLPSNSARIGVGIYKAGPVIYVREMY
jgi:hypothetical protein